MHFRAKTAEHNNPILGQIGVSAINGISGNGYNVVIDQNTIFSYRPETEWAVCTWGDWAVTNNALMVPSKAGNAAASTNGVVLGNYQVNITKRDETKSDNSIIDTEENDQSYTDRPRHTTLRKEA